MCIAEIKTKINKWKLTKLNELLHSKGNHKQTEKTTYRMGENICKQLDPQRLNFQNIQIAHTTQQQENPTNNSMGRRTK